MTSSPSPRPGAAAHDRRAALGHLAAAAAPHLPAAAATGAAALALSSTGSMVVASVLLGAALRNRWSTAALVLSVAAVAVRFSTTTFDDLAGIQSVLGNAGEVGPPTAAASAWLASAAIVLAVWDAEGPRPRLPAAIALAGATGAMSAAVVAGQGPGGDLWVRVAATAAATTVAGGLLAADRRLPSSLRTARPVLAAAAGAVAVVLAAWP